jgi:hypothetical protein
MLCMLLHAKGANVAEKEHAVAAGDLGLTAELNASPAAKNKYSNVSKLETASRLSLKTDWFRSPVTGKYDHLPLSRIPCKW